MHNTETPHDPMPAPLPGSDPKHPGETLQQQQEREGLMPSTQGPGKEPVHNEGDPSDSTADGA